MIDYAPILLAAVFAALALWAWRDRVRERRRGARMRRALDATHHPFYLIDAETYKIRYANRAGGRDKSVLGETCHMTSHRNRAPCQPDECDCPIVEIQKSKLPFAAEHVHYDKNGNLSVYEINAFPVFDEAGKVVEIAEFCREITDDPETARAMGESEKRYRNVVERSNDGIAIVQDAKIKYVNPAMTRMLGYELDEAKGMYFDKFFDPDTITEFGEQYRSRVKGEITPTRFESVLLSARGDRVFVEIDSDVMTFEGRAAALVFFRDVTERKRAEDRIQRYIAELTESKRTIERKAEELEEVNRKLSESEDELTTLNAAKDKFFSIIAHDLKSPFTALLSLAEVLSEDFDEQSSEETKEYFHHFHQAAKAAYELLENLLTWSRSQTGRIEIDKQNVTLNRAARETTTLLSETARAKGIELKARADDSVVALVDPFMVSTVLRNLVSNAIKFTEEGGVVEISARERDGMIETKVRDTGVGIKAEHLDKLFRIESKFSTIGTRDEKGTGLGLILCREFVEKNGGEIGVESEIGVGTTFTFTLPKGKSAEELEREIEDEEETDD
ncbi:MAG: PAS domain S-box protein [Ignavibacteriales bacterium]|nr:PAS domain S-box protein [Ignavibacteriales bacterium]